MEEVSTKGGRGNPPQRPSKLKVWVGEMRVPFLTASVVPVILGTAIAWASFGAFDTFLFMLALLAGIFVHLGTNIANDYFDHKSGADEANKEYVRPFTGGSRTIQQGLLTPKEVLSGALLFFALAAIIGIYLFFVVGWIILVIGLIGIFSGFFYTAPPFNLASRGIGELFVGLNFGILMSLGAFFVQTGVLAWEPVLAAMPVALLITAVLYINQFQDSAGDAAVGKRHLVVRMGRKRSVLGYILLMAFTYLSVIIFAAVGLISPFTLLILIALPLPILAIFYARKYYDKRYELAPANALTVLSHLLIGILLVVGYIFEGLGEGALIYLIPACVIFGLIIFLFFWTNWNIERKKGLSAETRKSTG
jgi:1,4-dihydroxy-2-naphthoate octaprenyltransferase